jgi:hypothetical protein
MSPWGIAFLILCFSAMIAAFLIPAWFKMRRDAKMTGCAGNLLQLWRLAEQYSVRHGTFPDAKGGDFWRGLTDEPRLLTCRMLDPAPGRLDYRGPARDVGTCEPNVPVGADHPGNHGDRRGGNVLRRSGEVLTVLENDPVWDYARVATSP